MNAISSPPADPGSLSARLLNLARRFPLHMTAPVIEEAAERITHLEALLAARASLSTDVLDALDQAFQRLNYAPGHPARMAIRAARRQSRGGRA